ncbi:hypothetical protein [Marivita sp.]|uniref:hypothetical protein n=1 Tax=Marivita sp. TaxID=2003365 RepID=UPI003F6A9349
MNNQHPAQPNPFKVQTQKNHAANRAAQKSTATANHTSELMLLFAPADTPTMQTSRQDEIYQMKKQVWFKISSFAGKYFSKYPLILEPSSPDNFQNSTISSHCFYKSQA